MRRDAFSRQYLTEKLARHGFAAMCSPVGEWVRYTDYLLLRDLSPTPISRTAKLGVMLKKHFMDRYEKRIKELLARSGLFRPHLTDVKKIIEHGRPFLSLDLCGEAILTIGASLNEIAEHSCGVIAIGPFGCMPNRVSESILNETMTSGTKLAVGRPPESVARLLDGMGDLPFLAIESDGSPFPQTTNAKLESFCLRARRLHERMRAQGVY